ncbi:hypothetical protein [Hazenella coriacea]|uniref:Uncharacterized protein n=1 Tax=Hazenella coriacea TaxID=1179467 RepID=A0A4R3LBM4_9BACL|nr:hypothetical protein [Hazenella coriacea]TCS94916.1 hypothetical protein EDD58_103341 [Hazenella coriacea]
MEFFEKLSFETVSGFATIGLFTLFLWMAGLVFLLFRELFSSDAFHIRDYLMKVLKWLLYSFEIVSYGGVIVGPIMAFKTEDEVFHYVMVTIAAIILSLICFQIRKRTMGFSFGRSKVRKHK